MRTKKIALPFLFFMLLSIFSSIFIVTAQSTLTLTVGTDKRAAYDKYDPITINGTVQYGAANPANVLVGVEVDPPNPTGAAIDPIVLRTVQTGSGELSGLNEAISSAYPTNGQYGPQTGTVQNNELAYFTVSVTDTDNQFHSGLLSLTIFDGNGVPIAIEKTTASIGPGGTQPTSFPVSIPAYAHAGNAYGYADLYTDLPKNGGIPMAQELSFQFTIAGGTPSSGPAPNTPITNAGNYNFSFRLPQNTYCSNGIYKVYATATYANLNTEAQATFDVLLIGDFNGAGSINGNDLFIFAAAYTNYYSGLGITNGLCDINNDGKIDSSDFFLFISAYIQYWSP